MKHLFSIHLALLLSIGMSLNHNIASAQNFCLDLDTKKETQAEDKQQEKADDKKSESSLFSSNAISNSSININNSSLDEELKRIFGAKSETSLKGSRIENIGKYFLDKYTGEVTLVNMRKYSYVRWRIPRDPAPDDLIDYDDIVNYQLIKYGNGDDDIVLLNINTGAMWVVNFKGINLSYKNTELKYIPAVDTN